MSTLIELAERRLVPDALIRVGIRWLCERRLQEEGVDDVAEQSRRGRRLLAELRDSRIALDSTLRGGNATSGACRYE